MRATPVRVIARMANNRATISITNESNPADLELESAGLLFDVHRFFIIVPHYLTKDDY